MRVNFIVVLWAVNKYIYAVSLQNTKRSKFWDCKLLNCNLSWVVLWKQKKLMLRRWLSNTWGGLRSQSHYFWSPHVERVQGFGVTFSDRSNIFVGIWLFCMQTWLWSPTRLLYSPLALWHECLKSGHYTLILYMLTLFEYFRSSTRRTHSPPKIISLLNVIILSERDVFMKWQGSFIFVCLCKCFWTDECSLVPY